MYATDEMVSLRTSVDNTTVAGLYGYVLSPIRDAVTKSACCKHTTIYVMKINRLVVVGKISCKPNHASKVITTANDITQNEM